MVNLLLFIVYTLVVLIGAFLVPFVYFDPYQQKLIMALGAVAIWRYSWFALNIIRAKIYQKVKFKKIREEEQQGGDELDPEHVFLLLTTFRIGTDVTIRVYKAAIEEAIGCGYDVTIVASIVEMSEERLIRKIFLSYNPPERVRLKIVRIKGTGKRDGLAAGFRAVANTPVVHAKSVVAVIDGDSILSEGLVRKCSRLFALNPNLGGLTTDEDAMLDESDLAHKIYKQWYKLRFAQRNITMSSLALSDRILTLTGRMSMIRADIVTSKAFIETVQYDHINHPRLGEFRFLTGDDKSSWFELAREGWDMIYVPDVVVYTIEEIPSRNFFEGSLMLMHRWYGNQYRTNARAVELLPTRLKFYPWYALIDQRITMWTTPYGFFLAIFGAMHWGWGVLAAYAWWVLFSRLLMTYAYRLSRRDILPSWPFFLYYNQLIGAFVKIYTWNHLYKQSWTRQKTKLTSENRFIVWYRRFSSNLTITMKLLIFITIINFLVLNITFDDLWEFLNIF